MKRNVLNSPRLSELKKQRRRAILNKLFISGFGFLIIFISLVYLSRINRLTIKEIKVVGNKVVDTQLIVDSIQQQIRGKYLWLFPKANILYYPQNAIKNNLQNQFKRLESITFSIKGNTLEVDVSERVAKYIWCGNMLADTSTEVCYFVDQNGYIFDQAPYFSGEVYFKFYGGVGSNVNPLGNYFYKQNFKKLILFKDTLISIGLKPIEIYVTTDGDLKIFLSGINLNAVGGALILNTDADFQNTAENLQAALTTEPLQTEFKTKYSSLQYIDLRFGNKVYYKFSTP